MKNTCSQAGEQQRKLVAYERRIKQLEQQLASANALIEQARAVLALNEVFMETPVAERKVQPFTQTHDLLAAIEQHQKGDK